MVMKSGVPSCNPTRMGEVFGAAFSMCLPLSSSCFVIVLKISPFLPRVKKKKKCRDRCVSPLPTNVLNSCRNGSESHKDSNQDGNRWTISSNPATGNFSRLAPTRLPAWSPDGVFCSMNNGPKGPGLQERSSGRLRACNQGFPRGFHN